MYLLSTEGSKLWSSIAAGVLGGEGGAPGDAGEAVSESLRAPFYYYLGTLLASRGRVGEAGAWLEAGKAVEPIPASAYLLDLLDRQGGEFVIPEVAFTDPRPWGHFSSLPSLAGARANFVERATESLPHFDAPLRFIDVGCGNGELGIRLARSLLHAGKTPGVGAVLLIDPSPGMLELAGRNLREAFGGAEVEVVQARLEDAGEPPGRFDYCVASSSVHHMPAEKKAVYLPRLARAVDHFLLSELEANHDFPELGSPELAFSVYQVFGRGVQWVMGQEAPLEVQRSCADTFLMTEAISILSQPRGERSEYHMMRSQWRALLDKGLVDFDCGCDSTCYADSYVEQFMLHYTRVEAS